MGGLRLSCVADPLPIELRESEGCAQCLGSVSALSIGPFPRLIDEPDENRSHTQRWITLLMQYGSEGRAIGKKWSHFRERLPRNQKKIHSAHCEMNVPVQSECSSLFFYNKITLSVLFLHFPTDLHVTKTREREKKILYI